MVRRGGTRRVSLEREGDKSPKEIAGERGCTFAKLSGRKKSGRGRSLRELTESRV